MREKTVKLRNLTAALAKFFGLSNVLFYPEFSEPVAIQSQIAPNTYRLSSGESANQSRLARVSAPPTRQSSRVSKGTLPTRYNDFVMPKP